MKVSELMSQLEMGFWHKVVFYAVNIPRHLTGKSLIVLPCMYKGDGFEVLRKINLDLDGRHGKADA